MSAEILLALAAFAFVASATPGPNNLMLMASGANFGFRRTIPHMSGIAIGFAVMLLLVGTGIAQVFERWPAAHAGLKIVSVLYMIWLAWKIATAAPPDGTGEAGRPMTFVQAAAFQWVNPKAWSIALTAVTLYAPGGNFVAMAAVAATFVVVNVPTISSWTLLGKAAGNWMSPQALRGFNLAMALLLIASLYPVLSA